MRSVTWIAPGLLLLACLVVLAIGIGSVNIPVNLVLDTFASRLFGVDPEAGTHPMSSIIFDLRFPRALLALTVGAGLGIVGCLLQTVTRNDLADPFLFGLSSGAATGAVLVITVTGDVLGVWTLPLAAFVGGSAASIIVLGLVARLRDQGPARLVLAGLAVSFLFTAITNYLVFAGDQRAAHAVLFWSLGGMGLARWDLLPIALAGLAIVSFFTIWKAKQLDALLAGDDTAQTLGVNVIWLRRLTFLVSAFATAAFVSITGVIGFVGLMVPHMARGFLGPLHGRMIVLAAMIGAGLLLISDVLARTLLVPQELPIGIITTSMGAVFVLLLLRRL